MYEILYKNIEKENADIVSCNYYKYYSDEKYDKNIVFKKKIIYKKEILEKIYLIIIKWI